VWTNGVDTVRMCVYVYTQCVWGWGNHGEDVCVMSICNVCTNRIDTVTMCVCMCICNVWTNRIDTVRMCVCICNVLEGGGSPY